MNGVVVFLLVIYIAAVGVHGYTDLQENRVAYCKTKYNELVCRSCPDLDDANYTYTVGNNYGSIATTTCPGTCPVGYDRVTKKHCIKNNHYTAKQNNRAIWKNSTAGCSCYPSNPLYMVVDASFDCSKACGTVAGSCPTCSLEGSVSNCCKIGFGGCTNDQKSVTDGENHHVCVRERPLDYCPDLGSEYSYTNGPFLGSVATKSGGRCSAGSKGVIKHICTNTSGIPVWTNRNDRCRCHNGCRLHQTEKTYTDLSNNIFGTRRCFESGFSCGVGKSKLEKRRCMEIGEQYKWSAKTSCKCRHVTCRNLGGGYLYTNGLKYGSVASVGNISCNCNSNGKWSSSDCYKNQKCRDLGSLYQYTNGFEVGSVATVGDIECECDTNGKWDNEDCYKDSIWKIGDGGSDCWVECGDGPCENDRLIGFCCMLGWTGDSKCYAEQQSVAYSGVENHHVWVVIPTDVGLTRSYVYTHPDFVHPENNIPSGYMPNSPKEYIPDPSDAEEFVKGLFD